MLAHAVDQDVLVSVENSPIAAAVTTLTATVAATLKPEAAPAVDPFKPWSAPEEFGEGILESE